MTRMKDMISRQFLFFRSAAWIPIIGFLLVTQDLQAVDLVGKLAFIDAPPGATPVEMLPIDIRSVAAGLEFSARPDRLGSFTLKNITPGHYRLHLTMPARIRTFALGSQTVSPIDFEIVPQGGSELNIVLSLASSEVVVKVIGLPSASDAVAILAPADPMLTLQESCIMNKLSSSETWFQFLSPGKYRLFIVDSRFKMDVAKYGPRLPTFLSSDAVIVDALDSTRTTVSANYIQNQAVEEAVHEVNRSK